MEILHPAIEHTHLYTHMSYSIDNSQNIMASNPMLRMKTPIFLVLLLLAIPQTDAFWGSATKHGVKSAPKITQLLKSSKTLPDDEIVRLSKLSDEGAGTAKIGKKLGKLDLPNDVLEDTFMRIAIHQKKISRKEAEGMFAQLSGTPGFRTTLRKIIGNSDVGTAGHLNELRIADTASRHGFKVLGIGEKFTDGLKKASTDIDIVLQKGGKYFAIEAKSYASTTRMPMDKYRADLNTLIVYTHKHTNDVIPVFAITNKPNDPQYLKLLKYEANKRDVQLIFGPPEVQIIKIKLLVDG